MPAPNPSVRVLAVSHEASQTGAPIVLANLLRWIGDHADVDIHTLALADGPLRPAFEAVGTYSAVDGRPGANALGLLERGLVARGSSRLWRVPAALRYEPALRRLGAFDLVYLNSLTSLEVVPHLVGRPKVVAHLHEAAVALAEWRHAELLRTSRHRPDRWIAVSQETADVVSRLPGASPEQISLHHPFIDVAHIQQDAPDARRRAALRRSLGIPSRAAVVVGCGTIDWRKGPDLFVQLATEVRRRRRPGERPVHFVWVGGDLTGQDWTRLSADITRSGADHVHLTGHIADPRPYFHLADVFALTSREDPYPLVCLEHAALGIPMVVYASSGISDFLHGAGRNAGAGVIPYLDVGGMAQQVIALLTRPDVRDLAVAEALAAVEARHDVATVAPAIAHDIGLAIRA